MLFSIWDGTMGNLVRNPKPSNHPQWRLENKRIYTFSQMYFCSSRPSRTSTYGRLCLPFVNSHSSFTIISLSIFLVHSGIIFSCTWKIVHLLVLLYSEHRILIISFSIFLSSAAFLLVPSCGWYENDWFMSFSRHFCAFVRDVPLKLKTAQFPFLCLFFTYC